MVPERNGAVIALFNHPAGYAVPVLQILGLLLELPELEPGAPIDASLALRIAARTTPLRAIDEHVFGAPNGTTTVGFPPGEDVAMFDDASIGLVCWPFPRCGGGRVAR